MTQLPGTHRNVVMLALSDRMPSLAALRRVPLEAHRGVHIIGGRRS